MRVSSPTPDRASTSAAQLPTPPSPTTHTWAPASRSMAAEPSSISLRKKRSFMNAPCFVVIFSLIKEKNQKKILESLALPARKPVPAYRDRLAAQRIYPIWFMPFSSIWAVTLSRTLFCQSAASRVIISFSQA